MHHRWAPIWRFHTGLCKFLRNISTNIWSLGKRTGLKLGEVSSSFILYNIKNSWLFPLDGFRFIFLLRDSENDLFKLTMHLLCCRNHQYGIEAGSYVLCERWKDTEQRDLQNGRKTSLSKACNCLVPERKMKTVGPGRENWASILSPRNPPLLLRVFCFVSFTLAPLYRTDNQVPDLKIAKLVKNVNSLFIATLH